MNRPAYPDLTASQNLQTFYFNSVGSYGIINKAVVYTQISKLVNTYNLGFGTLKIDEWGYSYIDGEDKTNNGDINKVLSTVAGTIEIFLSFYPETRVFFKGYSTQLTRLYQRALKADFDKINKKYIVMGNKDKREDFYKFEVFNPKKQYYGFMIQKKN